MREIVDFFYKHTNLWKLDEDDADESWAERVRAGSKRRSTGDQAQLGGWRRPPPASITNLNLNNVVEGKRMRASRPGANAAGQAEPIQDSYRQQR